MRLPSITGAGAYLICLAIVLVPVILVAHPPLVDYPNHLARLYILTHPDDPVLAQHYRISWSLLPNLGFDLLGLALAFPFPVDIAGRVFVGLSLAILLGAPMALHRALYGRISLLPLFAGAILYNRIVQMGFLSYLLGIGLAIWAFAAWHACRQMAWWRRYALLQVATLSLFLFHFYALAVLAVLIGLSAASEGWRKSEGTLRNRVAGALRRALPEALAFAPPALLLFLSETGGSGIAVEYEALWLKFAMLPMSLMLDFSPAGLIIAEAALLPPLIARVGGGRMLHPAVTWPAAAMFALYFIMPDKLLSSENADWRLLVPLVFVLIGAAEDPFVSARGRIAVSLLAIALNAAGSLFAWTHWRDGDRIAGNLNEVLAKLPRGATMIPYIPGDEEFRNAYRPPSVLHIGTLAVIQRAAFVPTVFAIRGQQPIEFREALLPAIAWHRWLHIGGPPPADLSALQSHSNYVLEIRTGYPVTEPVPTLPLPVDRVGQAGYFTLYRLRAGAI